MDKVQAPFYLTEIIAEIETMDEECFLCNEPIHDGEEKIERKLYALMQLTARELEQTVVDAKYSIKAREDHALHKRVDELHMKHNMLRAMLWAIVNNRLPHHCEKTVGVRNEWTIVAFPRMDLLKEFLS